MAATIVQPLADAESSASGVPALDGQRDQLARVYEASFDRLYAAARALTGRDEAFCLDVVQDAFLALARRPLRDADDAAVVAWLRKALVRKALDRLRAERRRARREADRPPAHTPDLDPASRQAYMDRIEWLAAALAGLREADRELLGLHAARGNTLAAAGEHVGLGVHAAGGRVRRALARVRSWASEVFP